MDTRTSRAGLVAITLLFLLPAIPASAAASDPFDQLRERFQEGQVLEADMIHVFTDAYTGETTTAGGRIWIGEHRYKIDVEEQVVVVNGEISRVYNKRQNKVIISEYIPEDDDFAPSRFLAGEDHAYDVQEQPSELSDILMVLGSTDPFDIFTRVEIHLTDGFIPVEITATDQTDNKFTTQFSDANFMIPDDDTFSFPHPDDAELIDLRY